MHYMRSRKKRRERGIRERRSKKEAARPGSSELHEITANT